MVSEAFSGVEQLVLDLDPALGAQLTGDDLERARQDCRGRLIRVGRGRWDISAESDGAADLLAFVVVTGLLSRETMLGDHVMFELLGAADVVRIPVAADRATLGGGPSLTAVTDSVLLGLGASFVRATAEWPSLMAAVLDRLEAQRARLAVQGSIMHFPRAEDRLLLTLWHLASRWGHRSPHGIVVGLPLTHAFLGRLTGASRPTVTVAVRTLEDRALVERLDDGSWLVPDAAERKVEQICHSHRSPALGEWLMVRHLHSDTADSSRALLAEAEQLSRHNRALQTRSMLD